MTNRPLLQRKFRNRFPGIIPIKGGREMVTADQVYVLGYDGVPGRSRSTFSRYSSIRPPANALS